jgi:LDH2 family malate/lactate/ureidoglycolate dehydrogenase
MDNWIERFRKAPAIEGEQVIIPGDPEREMEAERRLSGIPLLAPVVKDLSELGVKMGVTF